MPSTWHDGLVDAFPVYHEASPKTSEVFASHWDTSDASKLKQSSSNKNKFRFFDLPAELRNQVYELILLSQPERGIVHNGSRSTRLNILLTSKRFHAECSSVLYRYHYFRIFPIQDFKLPQSIREIPAKYRHLVTYLEMVVGSSWTNPPKSWTVTTSLAKRLARLKSVHTIRIFVELDPSHPIFAKYRISLDFYTDFCGKLLKDVLIATPQIRFVELDGNPGVDVDGHLVSRLRRVVEDQGRIIQWGKHSNWIKKDIGPES